jgi:hypothetical protein
MSDRRDGAPQQQVDRLPVEDWCRTARSSPTCPSLQSLVNELFHLAAWIALGDYAPGAVTGAVVAIPATGYFFAWVRRQARATAAELILAVAVGTVVAAVAIGFLSCLTAAPVSVRTALKTARYLTNQTISQSTGALANSPTAHDRYRGDAHA